MKAKERTAMSVGCGRHTKKFHPRLVLEHDFESNILETTQYVWFHLAIQLWCFVDSSAICILVVLMLKWVMLHISFFFL